MPYGSPTEFAQGSTYVLRASHSTDGTIPITVTVSMGDSGANVGDVDTIFQDVVDLFNGDPAFTITECRKSFPTQQDVTPS